MQKVYPSIKICNNRGNKILQIIRFKSTKELLNNHQVPISHQRWHITIQIIIYTSGSSVLEKATKNYKGCLVLVSNLNPKLHIRKIQEPQSSRRWQQWKRQTFKIPRLYSCLIIHTIGNHTKWESFVFKSICEYEFNHSWR